MQAPPRILLLFALWALPLAAAEAPAIQPAAVRAELDALAALLDTPGLGERAERLRAVHAEAAAALDAGRPHWALQRVAAGRLQTEALLFMRSQAEAAPDVAGFDRVWRAHAGILDEAAAAGRLAPCQRSPALVRALVEAAGNRASRHYHAARAIALANGQAPGGLFYLGRARAELDLVRLCAEPGGAADRPAASPVVPSRTVLRSLEDAVDAAYADADAAIEQHAAFIQLNAGIKELRELTAAGLGFGALDVSLAATLRLAQLGGSEGADAAAAKQRFAAHAERLDALDGDHSIARAYLERGATALAGDEDDQRLASAIADRLLPTYFERLEAAPHRQADRAARPGDGPVTVTLLRWPYT